MNNELASTVECADCRPRQPGFFTRYRDFLLSTNTLLTFANAFLLLVGVIVSILGAPQIGQWLYLAAAIIGGLPLFIFAAKGLFLHGDITTRRMASTATIAAIVIGEYAAAALVVFMMSVGEWLENFTIARIAKPSCFSCTIALLLPTSRLPELAFLKEATVSTLDLSIKNPV